MKKLIALLISTLFSYSLFAQVPQRMSYQTVIRNASNNLVSNAPVKIRISILQGGATGLPIYSELHNPITNANGLATIEIGGGTSLSGSFSAINWANASYFLKTETDPDNGNKYSIMGTSQLLSVPYALYAANAGNSIPGPQGLKGEKGDTGPAGPRGEAGEPGAQGSKGDKGDPGIQGDKGDKGDKGEQGATGAQGPKGDNGDKGDPGLPGTPGAQGLKGDKGDPGPQGLKGDKGDPGSALSNGTSNNQMMYWNGSAWVTLNPGSNGQSLSICNGVLTWTNRGTCPANLTSLNCSDAVKQGEIVSGANTFLFVSVPYSGGNGGFFSSQPVNSTGVTGLTATLQDSLLSFGSDSLNYIIRGIPGSSGTANFSLNIGGKSCILSIPVITAIPKLAKTELVSVTETSATVRDNITSDGGAEVTARGFVWSTSPSPTVLLATKTNNGSGVGVFTSTITGLTKDTTYYVRSYAINSVGTAYGNELAFIAESGFAPVP